MANMYSGQAAQGQAEGFKSGYNFVDKAHAASQEARAKEERIKKAIMENKLADVAYADAMEQTEKEQADKKKDEEFKVLQIQVQKSQATNMNRDIMDLASQPDISNLNDYVQTVKARIKANPEAYTALGIKNPESMTVLNPMDSGDIRWMQTALEKQGVVRGNQSDEDWKTFIRDAMDGYPVVKVDGKHVDLGGLGIATGAFASSSPAQQKIMTDNSTAYYDRIESDDKMLRPTIAEAGEEGRMAMDGYISGEQADETIGKALGTTPMPDTSGKLTAFEDMTPEEQQADTARTEAIKASEEKFAETDNSMESIQAFQDGHETANKDYTAVNKESGAYGRYQFIPKTMKSLADRLGMTMEEAKTPAGQDKLNEEFMKDKTATLEDNDIEVTPENMYALHQMGEPVGVDYLKGDINSSVLKAMKAQFPSKNFKSDQELIDTWENRFTSEGNTKISNIVTTELQEQGKPLDDMGMRKIYALLGRTYPKSDKSNKIKELEYLSSVVGKDKAFDAVYGDKTKSTTLSRIGKVLRDADDAKYRGDMEQYDILMNRAEKLSDKRTSTKYSYDKAIKDNKVFTKSGIGSLSADELIDYNANLETIENYNLTVKQQNIEGSYKENERVDNLEIDIANEMEEFKSTGLPISSKTETSLKQMQRIRRANNTEAIVSDRKKLDEMNGKRRTANSLAKVINRLEDGDLKGHERGIIENVAQWTQKIIGIEGDEKSKSYLQEQAMKSVKLRSRLGIIQANYIKAMSGTAASDAERQFLVEIIGSSTWDDESALHEAIKEFYNSTVEDIQDYQTEVSPYSEYKAKLVDPIKSGGRKDGEEKANVATMRADQRLPTKEEYIKKTGSDKGYNDFITRNGG